MNRGADDEVGSGKDGGNVMLMTTANWTKAF